MRTYLVTSESVTEGHPDKLCDQISDAILDAYLKQDPESRVAVDVMASKNTLMIAGEVRSKADPDVVAIARSVIRQIGYDDEKKGMDYRSCQILTNLNQQSADIARGVDASKRSGTKKKELGAGDQGIMYGYASNETPNLMPMTMDFASKLAMQLGRVKHQVDWIYPDGKTQVTMKYDEHDCPLEITSLVVSVQHQDGIDIGVIRQTVLERVIEPIIDPKWMTPQTRIHVNPTGRFVIGGPLGDTGLTGKKIMIDTYGGVGKHGGGSFSGKDATKVDRTGAYMARYVAKNIVAAGLADRCEVSMAFAIGLPEPEAITVNTFGTEKTDIEVIEEKVRRCFSFSVAKMIETLDLKRPQFLKTAVYGHFGRENEGFAWEKTDRIECLREK